MKKANLRLLNIKCLKILKDLAGLSLIFIQAEHTRSAVHAQHIGNSIVCDELYGSAQPIFLSTLKHKYNLSKKEEEEKPILSRLALHAASLKFNLNNKEYFFEAPLPKDLKAMLQQLRKIALV